MKKALLTITAIAASALCLNAQNLAEFGSTATNLFTIDPGSYVGWDGTTASQTASGMAVTGSDLSGNQFAGTFASPWTLSSNSPLTINITGTTPSPGSQFTVTLFSTDFTLTKQFEGNFAEPGAVDDYNLTFQLETAPFTSIGGFQFTAGGAGNAQNISINSLAVPEPSTYLLMALGGLFLVVFARRRKAQA